MADLAQFTTLRLGGPIGTLVECTSATGLVATVRQTIHDRQSLLVLGGGSNLVAADTGFSGVVARVQHTGIEVDTQNDQTVLTVQAGESWDSLVDFCERSRLSGLECLSGIPGSVGATPIQNVGAYGQEVSESIAGVRVYDRITDQEEWLAPKECQFGYRSSRFKTERDRWVILAVRFALEQSAVSQPIRYRELARALGIEVGESAPLGEVRAAVLALRRAKGMVLDPADLDSVSAGSFFLNPVLSAAAFEQLTHRVHDRQGPDSSPPSFPAPDNQLKTSAAWLIERAGFTRGYGRADGIAISGKHTLALTNRGTGTTRELMALADEITARVYAEFGVHLHPEPIFVGDVRVETRSSPATRP